MNSYAMNSFKDIHIWIHEHLNSYMNSTLWIHDRLHLNKRLHATCLATSNLPMLSSSSGIINCSKVFTLPFILPILAMVCMLLIRSHTDVSGWHPLATRCDWSWLISSTQPILSCLCKLQTRPVMCIQWFESVYIHIWMQCIETWIHIWMHIYWIHIWMHIYLQ